MMQHGSQRLGCLELYIESMQENLSAQISEEEILIIIFRYEQKQ